MINVINVLIYNEFIHEKTHEEAKKNYPDGIHKCIGSFLKSDDITISYATLDDIETTITKEMTGNAFAKKEKNNLQLILIRVESLKVTLLLCSPLILLMWKTNLVSQDKY